jgi:hypothetical protein
MGIIERLDMLCGLRESTPRGSWSFSVEVSCLYFMQSGAPMHRSSVFVIPVDRI